MVPAEECHSLHSLRQHVSRDLPLRVSVSSTSVQAKSVVYNCTVSSASKITWIVSYRYSEFLAFRVKLEDLWTCHDSNCSGSCQALRDIVAAYFPKKWPLLFSNQVVVAARKRKLELVLTHLLRSVLLPGSAMACLHARQNLPINVFGFLRVKSDVDRRSALQICVDNYQIAVKKENRHAVTQRSDSKTVGCMICLCDVDLEHGHQQCDNSLVVLPCDHVFHRWCIFQRLMFTIHCPVCRMHVSPYAVTNYCHPTRNSEQWWLSDFGDTQLQPKRC
ncbi:hypothetical protein V7S43_010370 [Phytophthora oleae]|uniref:RING-type domain-containing protein n=1 Tax=Phytophthora oleae TaxID=2107226 RepID=A0ABD3FE98_9STRA